MNETAVLRILEAIDAIRRLVAPMHAAKKNEG